MACHTKKKTKTLEAPQKIEVSNLQVPNYIGENEDNFHGMANGIKKSSAREHLEAHIGNPLGTY